MLSLIEKLNFVLEVFKSLFNASISGFKIFSILIWFLENFQKPYFNFQS